MMAFKCFLKFSLEDMFTDFRRRGRRRESGRVRKRETRRGRERERNIDV